VALHDAQKTARDSVPKVTVQLEDTYENPCVLTTSYKSSHETTRRPVPETLDPVRAHRLDFLGKRFRGILANHDSRAITVIADRGLFVEGVTPLWNGQVSLPQAQSAGTWLLAPGNAALFEWFGSCTVIDWYELARMPDPFETRAGVHVPYTVITVNHAGDEQWVLPTVRVVLKFQRLPVYLPLPGSGHDGSADRELLLLGGDGRGVACDVRYESPRVPQAFADLTRTGS
jgi:hypothetical protein